MQKRAFITGITGQDGAYLSELLLNKGYSVFGFVRNIDPDHLWRLQALAVHDKVQLIQGNITDQSSLTAALKKAAPNEVYNLAAQSYVSRSWNCPVYTSEVTGLGVVNLLDSIQKVDPTIHFFQASSSEMFGATEKTTQNELTLFNPRSPYGVAKLFGHYMTRNYRDSYNFHGSSGILFNHDSPLRAADFVSRKISSSVASIVRGEQEKIVMGNIDVYRDWGYAKDYVEAMWMTLQQDTSDDYIIATGTSLSVREICRLAFNYVGLDYENYLEIDPKLYRPADIEKLQGDATKIQRKIGWKAQTPFEKVVGLMIESDLNKVQQFA